MVDADRWRTLLLWLLEQHGDDPRSEREAVLHFTALVWLIEQEQERSR